jgi:hypothetical protein
MNKARARRIIAAAIGVGLCAEGAFTTDAGEGGGGIQASTAPAPTARDHQKDPSIDWTAPVQLKDSTAELS